MHCVRPPGERGGWALVHARVGIISLHLPIGGEGHGGGDGGDGGEGGEGGGLGGLGVNGGQLNPDE